jgi:hypothetical protein
VSTDPQAGNFFAEKSPARVGWGAVGFHIPTKYQTSLLIKFPSFFRQCDLQSILPPQKKKKHDKLFRDKSFSFFKTKPRTLISF